MDDWSLEHGLIRALPELDENTVKTITDHLRDLGVQKRDDVSFVEKEDILPFLTPIQTRRLMKTFKKR